MDLNEQTTEEIQVTEKKSKLPYIFALASVFLLTVLAFVFFSTMSNNNITNEDVVSEDFLSEINDFGQLMNIGRYDQALVAANELLATSDTDLERGRASLSVGIAQLRINPAVAVESLKTISQTDEFHPFVRAMAIWYTVEIYLGNRDATFARDHIYTGNTWNEFVDTTYSDNSDLMYRLAGISALRASLDLSITAQAAMRLAAESAGLLQYQGLSDIQKTETANTVQQYIALAEQDLVEIRNQNILHYAGTEFVVVTSVLNSKALALDALYVGGQITDIGQVADAYEAALEAAIAYDLQTSHPFFIRYNYADFLARTDVMNSTTTIIALLQPMVDLNSDSSFAGYLNTRLTSAEAETRDEQYTGHPRTMRMLAVISPEFRSALFQIGLSEPDIAFTTLPDSSTSTEAVVNESSE
jgi:hypothetical protein